MLRSMQMDTFSKKNTSHQVNRRKRASLQNISRLGSEALSSEWLVEKSVAKNWCQCEFEEWLLMTSLPFRPWPLPVITRFRQHLNIFKGRNLDFQDLPRAGPWPFWPSNGAVGPFAWRIVICLLHEQVLGRIVLIKLPASLHEALLLQAPRKPARLN